MSERADANRPGSGAPGAGGGAAGGARPAGPKRPRELSDEERRAHLQRQLDEALAESFPASDPVSIVTSQREEDFPD